MTFINSNRLKIIVRFRIRLASDQLTMSHYEYQNIVENYWRQERRTLKLLLEPK